MKPCGHDEQHENARGGHRWMEAKIQSSPRARAKRVTVEGCAGLFWCSARWRTFSKNGPDSLCTVVQISVRLGLVGCCHVRARDIEFGRLCIYIAANASSDVVKRCLSFISTILSPSDFPFQFPLGKTAWATPRGRFWRFIWSKFWPPRWIAYFSARKRRSFR